MHNLQVAKHNGHWGVRDAKGDKVSPWYRKKSEAYTHLNELKNEPVQQSEELPATYQVLDVDTGRWSKFQKGKWTLKKSEGPWKKIPIVEQ